MSTEETRKRYFEDPDAPMEGDEGEVEIRRHRDVGRAILETTIRDVKSQPPLVLPADATVAKAIALMKKKKVGAVMVVEKKRTKRLVGIFGERDIVARVLDKKGYGRLSLAKVMTPDPETLQPKDGLAYALNKMSVGRFRHVPLVDDEGRPVGMLSIRDIIDFFVELIPEEIMNLPPEPKYAVPKTVDGG